jgi:hypothetical protein
LKDKNEEKGKRREGNFNMQKVYILDSNEGAVRRKTEGL